MTKLGYWASQEQYSMKDLFIFVKEAEKSGFDQTLTSDHFHPWSHNGGYGNFKIGGLTIERIFDFDKNTDIGPIQIGDRFHGCASGEGLKPKEGTECEKRLIKDLDKVHTLPVHAKVPPKP
jgi:hypothetical protein